MLLLLVLHMFRVLRARRQAEPAIACDKDTMTMTMTENISGVALV